MTTLTKHNPSNILNEEEGLRNTVAQVLKQAQILGASSAEVGASIENGFSTTVRMGEVDTVEYNRDKVLAVTVYFGQCKGSASTSDTSERAILQTVQAACDIAKVTHEDPYAGLADKELMAFDYPDLDLYHPWDLTPDQGIELAKSCEAKAFTVDKRITNSEGAIVSSHQGIHVYGNSHDFIGAYPSSRHSLSCVLVAQSGESMQRDYDYTVARDPLQLENSNKIAETAAKRTVDRLNARRLKTQKAPVIFAADIARGLLGHLVSAISGGNLYREASFLLNQLNQEIFPTQFSIYEDPHLKGALGSAPYDNEGVATEKKDIIKEGILNSYLLGCYSARKLGLQSTGNAGGIHNLMINTSDMDLAALLQQMDTGLLVTEVMGHGVNIVTGDYSRGASGFWVEKGEIIYPVEEITIAGNLADIFKNIVTVANDVDIRGSIRSGSMLIKEMMIAGV